MNEVGIHDILHLFCFDSDRILGAIVKGNAVSFGVFKGFLIWCDNLMKHIIKLGMARTEGFVYPIFYYESILEVRFELKYDNIVLN